MFYYLVILQLLIFLLFTSEISAQSDPELIILQDEYSLCQEQEAELRVVVIGTPPVSISYSYNNVPGNANSTIDTIVLDLNDSGIFVITGYRDCCTDYIPRSDTIRIYSGQPSVYFTGGGYQCNINQIDTLTAHFEGTPPFKLRFTLNGVTGTVTTDTYTFTFHSSSEYELITQTVYDAFCHRDYIDTLYFIYGDMPVPQIEGDSIVCLNSTSLFEINNLGYSGHWSIPGISTYIYDSTSQGLSLTVHWTQTGTYGVHASFVDDNHECESAEAIQTVTVYDVPIIPSTIDTTICIDQEGFYFVLQVEGNSVEWPELNQSGASITFQEPGDYMFIVSNDLNCSDTGTLTITNNCSLELFVPEAFSPNEDGLNDVLEIFGNYSNLEFSVYSPSGILLFRSTSDDNFWDGTSEGKDIPEGSYYWHGIFTGADGQRKIQQGVVTIIR